MRALPAAALLGLFLNAALFVSGCSSGPASISTDLLAAKYTGDWSGNWQDRGHSWTGTLAFAAGSDGALYGTCTRIPWGSGDLSGVLYSNGDISLTYNCTSYFIYTFSGNLNMAIPGRASGVLNEYDHGTKIGTAEVTLQKNS